MFSLIAGLFRYLFSKTEINVLILGLDYAGKTRGDDGQLFGVGSVSPDCNYLDGVVIRGLLIHALRTSRGTEPQLLLCTQGEEWKTGISIVNDPNLLSFFCLNEDFIDDVCEQASQNLRNDLYNLLGTSAVWRAIEFQTWQVARNPTFVHQFLVVESGEWVRHRRSFIMTLLEQMKGIFKKVQGIPPSKIPPTVGLNVGKMDVGGCKLTFWDLGGQVRVRSLWEKYYADAHGLIFVMDSADVGRFEEARMAFDTVKEQGELHGVPLMMLANKQDLPEAISADEIAVQFDVHKITKVAFRLQPCSGLTCEGIAEGIHWIVNEAKKRGRPRVDV